MTTAAGIWIASIVGALVFFLAGFMTAMKRRLATSPQRMLEHHLGQIQPPSAAASAQVPSGPASAAEIAKLTQERDELRRRLEYFEGQVGQPTSTPVPLIVDYTAVQFRSPTDRTERGTSSILDGLLSNVGNTEGVHAVAFADELGLPIAGSGEYTESLAAFAGYLEDVASKSRKFLPMADLRRITVEDVNGEIVSACPMQSATNARVSLVTLTAAPGPSTGNMTELLKAAANIL